MRVTDTPLLTIGQVVTATGMTERTVRYCVSRGLVRCVRTEGGHRRFDAAALDALLVVRALRVSGRSLAEAAAVLRDPVRFENVRFSLQRSAERCKSRVCEAQDA
jgi:DNA-binding transcriptional MerR regulator